MGGQTEQASGQMQMQGILGVLYKQSKSSRREQIPVVEAPQTQIRYVAI